MYSGLMLILFFLLLTVFLVLKTIVYYKEIQKKVKENPEETMNHSRNIAYGVITGGSVVVIERIVDLMIVGFVKINLKAVNFWELFGSLTSLLIYTSLILL